MLSLENSWRLEEAALAPLIDEVMTRPAAPGGPLGALGEDPWCRTAWGTTMGP